MSPPAALFDFDGTLADSLQSVIAVYNDIAAGLELPPFSAANAAKVRSLGPLEAMRAFAVPVWKVPLIMKAVRSGLRSHIPNVLPFPGIAEALTSLHQAGCRCFVLSSNSRDNVSEFLSRHRLHSFEMLSCGTSLLGKGARIRKLVKRANLIPSESFYVGDEVRDVAAAAEAGVRSIAVSWGYSDRAALLAQNPDYLVDTPEELANTLING